MAAVASSRERNPRSRSTVEHKPDIAILDVAMPQLNGMETTRQIVRYVPDARVLVLSMHAEEAYVTQVLHDVHSAVEIVLYAVRRGIIR